MTHNYIYHRRKKNTGFKKGFSIFFVVGIVALSLVLMINIADIFSSLISNDKSIFSAGKIRISNSTMYAISVGQFADQQQAELLSTQVSSQGGAGYVYHSGDYFVFTSLYDSIVDAKSVVEKL